MAVNTSGKTRLPQPASEDYTQYARNTLKNLNNVYEKFAVRGPVLALVRPAQFSKLVITSDGGLQHSELKGIKVLCDPVLQRSYASGNVKAAALLRACLSPTLEMKESNSGYVVGDRGSLLTCGDVESNPGPIGSWLRGVVPVIYRKAADASLVQSVVTKTGSELFAEASRRNAQVAEGIWAVASRMKCRDMHKYGGRYSKLSQKQAKLSGRLATASRQAETRAHAFQKAWNVAHNAKLAARKGGLFALFGAGVVLSNETKPQVSCEPADNTASSVHPLVHETTRARRSAATGSAINTISGEPIYPAMEILYAASELETTNPEYWGRLYVRAFKFTLVHFMQSHNLEFRKQGRGVAIGFQIPASSKTIPNADLVAVFVEYVDALRCCHNVASECGDWSDNTVWQYNIKGITCAYVGDVLLHSLERLQIHPSLLSNRLSSVYTECAEFATTEDWSQELTALTGHHHLSALCDPSICQYSGLCATLSSTAAYKDAHEVSYLLKCISHSRSVAAVRGKIMDPTTTTACGSNGTGGSGRVPTLAVQQASRPVSYVAAVAGCPRSDSPGLVFDPSGESATGGGGGEGPSCTQSHGGSQESCNLLPPDSRDAQDVGGQSVSMAKERAPEYGGAHEARTGSQGGGLSDDSLSGRGRVSDRPAKELSIPLVGDQSPEVRMEQSVGVVAGKNNPDKVATKVGHKTGRLRPGGPTRSGKSQDNRTGIDDGAVRLPEAADVIPTIPGTLLEPLGPRGLQPQPAASCEGKSAGKSTTGNPGGNVNVAPSDGTRSVEFTAVNCTFELGRVYIRVPAEQEEALRDGTLRVFVARFDPKGCHGQGVCENGEVANTPKTRGPSTHTVQGDSVPPVVLNDDQTPRARSHARKRSRNKPTNGGKGPQSGSASSPTSADVEAVRTAGEHIVRPQQVGHARASPVTQQGAGDLQPTRDLPATARYVPEPTQERVLHKQGHTIPRRWRNHEWGYDDGSRELHCSTCHSYVLPGRYKKACYHERKQHARRVGGTALKYGNPRSGVSSEVSRDKSPSSGRSVETGVAKHIRRRRRPRDNLREGTHVDMRTSSPSVVDSHGSLPESGRHGGGFREHRVLPTQTMEWRNSAYNGPQSSKSFAQVVYGNREVHQQTPIVPPYGLDREGHPSYGYPAPWAVFPEQCQATGWSPPHGSGQLGIPTYQLVPTLPYEIPRQWHVPAGPAEGRRDGQSAVLANVGHFANGAV
ncbi:p130 [Providence virus]|uniref:p130 n=2 Tax=Providence virus TaxID=213633 RepID=D6Q003_PRVFL|nr:p130 [Providence virus]ADG04362.1 p130 [Providence virus]AOF39952.1 p130 [Providence virus]